MHRHDENCDHDHDHRRAILIGAKSRRTSDLSRVINDLHLLPQDLRVGVDGGVMAWKRLGLAPHFALGDWDSLEDKSKLKGVVSLTLPREKDRSDLYYACDAAIELGATELVCIGVTGGRSDHHMATLLDLSEIAARHSQLKIITAIGDDGQYFFISPQQATLKAEFPKNQLVSIFAMGGTARGVTIDGFKYKMKSAELFPSSQGLSNLAKGGMGTIQVKKGNLLVIVPETATRENHGRK